VAGIPAAALMLANALLPMAVITLWFAAASISLCVRRPSPRTTAIDPVLAGVTPATATA
jgi:hypothetical protein